jgi:hypothetical protein
MASYQNMSGDADAEWFKELAKLYPSLFFPMFHMQMRLQERICGKQFWRNLANKRVCGPDGKVLYIKDIIGFHSNKKATRAIAEPKMRRHSAPSPGAWGLGEGGGGRDAEFVDLVEAANIKSLQTGGRERGEGSLTVGDYFEQ